MASKEAEEFRSSLCDLTVNSKPLISMLTMLAEESQAHSEQIVKVIETHILQVKSSEKLPSLYLIDSILKNLRSTDYATFFQQIIVKVFCHVFEQVDEKTRQNMFKLRQTWSDVLAARKLYALDVRVNQIDPAWPVAALPETLKEPTSPGSIHVNPKFLTNSKQSKPTASVAPSSTTVDKSGIAQVIEEKQKELAAIQKMQVELELAKAKAQLEMQQREFAELLARQKNPIATDAAVSVGVTAPKPAESTPSDPRVKRIAHTPAPVDPRRPAASIAPVSERTNPISAPLLAKPDRPASSSVGALLNQVVADQALEQFDSTNKVVKRKGTKLPKGMELDKEDPGLRGFSSRAPSKHNNRRSFGERGDHRSRGAFHSYHKPERKLPYDRPSADDWSDSSSRRRRRDRSRSRSRSHSPKSRSRSLSPKRESNKGDKQERHKEKDKPVDKSIKANQPGTSTEKQTKMEDDDISFVGSSVPEKSSSLTDTSKDTDRQATKVKGSKSEETLNRKADKKDNSKSADDLDLRKRKKSPDDKKTVDTKSDSSSKKVRISSPAPRSFSPSVRKSPSKKRADLPVQDEDLRKRDSPLAFMDKDEDLRTNREKLMKVQWESSKAKQMPRIPKRKVKKAQYRERDDTSPLGEIPQAVDGGLLAIPDQEKPLAAKSDVDLRSLPVVRAPSRGNPSSSDSEAEVLADLDKRRKQRNKIVEGKKSDKDRRPEDKDVDLRVSSREKKRKQERQKDTFDEDEDFRVRPPQPKSKPPNDEKGDTDLRKKLSVQIGEGKNESSENQDEDLRVPPSPASHTGWNKHKEANPSDFYTPNKMSHRRQSGVEPVTPLHMNAKGLDLLDQKDRIVEQARMQWEKGEITKAEYEEVKHRFQELELIKRAQRMKANSGLVGDRHQRINNPYDQRGGGPMTVQRHQHRNMPRFPANTLIQPNLDPQMLQLLLAIRNNSDDPQLKALLSQLQGGTASRRQPSRRGGNMSSNRGGNVNTSRRGLLPTPDIPNSSWSRNSLSRTNSGDMPGRSQATHEFVIDGQPFELGLGMKPRRIPIGKKRLLVQADIENREIRIDGNCHYKIGDKVRSCYIAGVKHEIFYRGPLVTFWLDRVQMDVRIDAPPRDLQIDNKLHNIQLEGHTNQLLVDGKRVGQFGGEPLTIMVDGMRHYVAFEAPPREILVDGKTCRLQSDGPTPVIIIDGKAQGIRFDGPPREIMIDDMSFMVPMDRPQRIKIGMRAHMLAFGGPGQEVLIDSKPYEVIFNGPPRVVRIGGTEREIRLFGDPPDVKILGEILPDELNGPMTGSGVGNLYKPLAPPPRPPARGGLLPTPPSPLASDMFNEDSDMRKQPVMRPPGPAFNPLNFRRDLHGPRHPSSFNQQNQRSDFKPHHDVFNHMTLDPRESSSRPDFQSRPGTAFKPDFFKPPPGFPSNFVPPVDTKGSTDQQQRPLNPKDSAPAAQAPALDINSLFKKLLDHGIISKKEEVDKMEHIPDLSTLAPSLLQKRYEGVVQRLYTGNQCSMCGLRFLKSAVKKYENHHDWHFRQNTKERNRSMQSSSRNWYIQVEDWISYEEFSDITQSNVFLNTQTETGTSSDSAVPIHPEAIMCPKATGTEENDNCCVCREPFERYWNDDEEEWHLKDAVQVQDKTYHPVCYEDAVESSILERSQSGDENSSSTGQPGSIPQSPRISIPPQSPLTPIISPTANVPPVKEALTKKDSNSSQSAPKSELDGLGLLTNLIQKTNTAPPTPKGAKDDPLIMLAGIMKNVKPPDIMSVQVEHTEKQEEATDTKIKQEPELKIKQETSLKIEPIGTLNGSRTPTAVKSNVTLLTPQSTSSQEATTKATPVQSLSRGATQATSGHSLQPSIRPNQAVVRAAPLSHPQSGPSITQAGPRMAQSGPSMAPGVSQMPQCGPPISQSSAPIPQGGSLMTQGGPPITPGGPVVSQGGLLMAQGGPPMAQGGPPITPGGPVMSQGGPVMSQGGPLMSQGGPLMSQGGPLMSQGGSLMAQGGPLMAQGGPLMAQGGPLMAQGGPPIQQRMPIHPGGQIPGMMSGRPTVPPGPSHIAPLSFAGPTNQYRNPPPIMASQGGRFPGVSPNVALVGNIVPNVNRPPMMMSRPPIGNTGQPMMALAGAQPHTMMSTGQANVIQRTTEDSDDGTPVRDEREDDVERCPTPVMDEHSDDGGSTPVRDEWD
ncbi:pre-mRNA cleavage complex 2 protein Pcf11-like [Watersipora subatra]|uniref:pre-mRNA cleavage complex 2 protein Pcf11-like n=1 Tax=Watersipora subatra TaxID=2589382 RepID=UPI00355C5F89